MGDTCEELKYPEWQKPLEAAVLELDRDKLAEKILKVEAMIVERLRELPQSVDGQDEKEAIRRGLSLIKNIKHEKLGYPDVQ